MIAFRRLSILLCALTGFGSYGHSIDASEPPIPFGEDRLLVMCLPTPSDDMTVASFYDNVNWGEFADRHLTIFEISPRAVLSARIDNHGDTKGVIHRTAYEDFDDQLRQKAKCENTLEFVLIGKDMGVKKRWENSVPQDKLFQIIDAMPMRRYEMQQNQTRRGK